MSYDDLRKGRYSQKNRIYCVTTVTNDRYPFFVKFTAARLLVGEMRHLHINGQVVSLAWVIMPDHLHWLLQLSGESSLSDVVKLLKGRSSRKINEALGRQGSLWQRAFHERAMRREDNIRNIARYIVANPLRAGLVSDMRDYSHWDCVWVGGADAGFLGE